jgi:hypothetical protein
MDNNISNSSDDFPFSKIPLTFLFRSKIVSKKKLYDLHRKGKIKIYKIDDGVRSFVDRAEFENLFKPAQITASPKFNSKKKK